MAKGLEWTSEQKDIIIHSLKPYLELGYSRNKACDFIGLAPSTLSNWLKDKEELGMKLLGWENTVNTIVMANLVDAINAEAAQQDDTRKETTKWWAERRMKADFSTRQEVTGAEGNNFFDPEQKQKMDGLIDEAFTE
jgi:hypothetical protein